MHITTVIDRKSWPCSSALVDATGLKTGESRICREFKVRRFLSALALLVLAALLEGPAVASAQPYSEQAAFGTLYTSFGLLQALDVHSTSRAIASGATESNSLMSGIADRPVLLMGTKMAVTAGTVLLIERFRKRHPKAAMLTMIALNSAYAVVVVRNSRIAYHSRGPASGVRDPGRN